MYADRILVAMEARAILQIIRLILATAPMVKRNNYLNKTLGYVYVKIKGTIGSRCSVSG